MLKMWLPKMVENNSHFLRVSMSMPDIFRVLVTPYSTIQKVLRHILHFYLYKIQPVHSLQDGNAEVIKLLFFSSVYEWCLTSIDHGTFCGVFSDAWMNSSHFLTAWSPRSPDTLCNFSFWGFPKFLEGQYLPSKMSI